MKINRTFIPFEVKLLNIIWCFDRKTNQVKVILKDEGDWTLPETYLIQDEDALDATIRLTHELTGQTVSPKNIEQLETLTNPKRVVDGKRLVTMVYMTYLPEFPEMMTSTLELFTLENLNSHYYFTKGEKQLAVATVDTEAEYYQKRMRKNKFYQVNDYVLKKACLRIRHSLDTQPDILRILGEAFTLREARSLYAPFLGVSFHEIDNSNFKKTHQRLFREIGKANKRGPGRPASLYRLRF